MPYFKPEEAFRLQVIAAAGSNVLADNYYDYEAVRDAMSKCPVCGRGGCDKSIVEANNVWVHPADVEAATEHDNPEIDFTE